MSRPEVDAAERACRATLVLHTGAEVIFANAAALFVSGSVLDGDLTRPVEGAMQALLVEEAPVTPVRLILVGLGALLAVTQVWLIVALDGSQALVALAALTAVVVASASACGRIAMPRLVR